LPAGYLALYRTRLQTPCLAPPPCHMLGLVTLTCCCGFRLPRLAHTQRPTTTTVTHPHTHATPPLPVRIFARGFFRFTHTHQQRTMSCLAWMAGWYCACAHLPPGPSCTGSCLERTADVVAVGLVCPSSLPIAFFCPHPTCTTLPHTHCYGTRLPPPDNARFYGDGAYLPLRGAAPHGTAAAHHLCRALLLRKRAFAGNTPHISRAGATIVPLARLALQRCKPGFTYLPPRAPLDYARR